VRVSVCTRIYACIRTYAHICVHPYLCVHIRIHIRIYAGQGRKRDLAQARRGGGAAAAVVLRRRLRPRSAAHPTRPLPSRRSTGCRTMGRSHAASAVHGKWMCNPYNPYNPYWLIVTPTGCQGDGEPRGVVQRPRVEGRDAERSREGRAAGTETGKGLGTRRGLGEKKRGGRGAGEMQRGSERERKSGVRTMSVCIFFSSVLQVLFRFLRILACACVAAHVQVLSSILRDEERKKGRKRGGESVS
jgi:hypothetical protein